MSDRIILLLASAWNLVAGIALLTRSDGAGRDSAMPSSRARAIGGIVVLFGVLYATLAIRPVRVLLVISTVAKSLGGVSGLVGLLVGRRDAVTVISLADGVWAPGFALIARR